MDGAAEVRSQNADTRSQNFPPGFAFCLLALAFSAWCPGIFVVDSGMRFRFDPSKTFCQHWLGAFAAYVVLDVLFTALGMGVPLFAILFGLSVGWFGAVRALCYLRDTRLAMKRVLRYGFLCSVVTLVVQAAIWGRLVPRLFDQVVNPGSMGLPLILYEPKASLAGWVALMVFVSPFLQFAMIVLGAYLTFLLMFRLWPGGPPRVA